MEADVIAYHGLPITPASAAAKVLNGRHAFVSFAHPEQLEVAQAVCSSFALDNGAFSNWTQGKPTDWAAYSEWVSEASRHPGYDFCVIPDSIDGDEAENDVLVEYWGTHLPAGAPVWHLHESTDRLLDLARAWPRVCLGSSGKWATPGTEAWWARIAEALDVVCDVDGYPRCKLHGLRMMDPELRKIPFASVDSTSVGRNIGIDGAWGGRNPPPTKEWRALVLAERFEHAPCAYRWERSNQMTMFAMGA